jgi:hypothetical protein
VWASFYWAHDQVDLGARFVSCSKNCFNKPKWLDSMRFFMVVMPFDLWYVMRPFLHLVRMAKISRGVVSL